jgi:uncharacterized protein DUF3471/uncharacterized protein DUF4440
MLLALLLAAQNAPAQRTRADSALVEQLATVRRSAQLAAAAGDSAGFSRYVTSDFAFVHSTGGVDDAAKYIAFASRAVADSSWLVRPNHFVISSDVVVRTGTSANRIPGRGVDTYHGVDVFVLHDGSWRWAFHQTTRVPRTPTAVAVSPAALDAYAGRYSAAGGGSTGFVVTREGDGLLATSTTGQRSVLRPYTETSFFVEGLPATVVFVRDTSGRVAVMEMHRREAVARFVRAP